MRTDTLQVLIAEDNEPDVFLIRETLNEARLNYHASVATNGERALAAIDAAAEPTGAPLDLVILDLNLITHSGLEVLERLRKQPTLAGTKVVILTSSVSPQEQEKAMALGADLFLHKPLDWSAFLALGTEIVQLLKTPKSTT